MANHRKDEVPQRDGDRRLQEVKDKAKAAKGIHKLEGVTSAKLRKNEARGTFMNNSDDIDLDRGGPDISSSKRR